MKEPLRIGLLLDDWTVPRWVEDIVWTIQHSTYARIVLVIRADPSTAPAETIIGRIWRNRGSLAYYAYQHLDRRLFARADDPWARRDLRPLLEGVPEQIVTPRRTAFSDRIEDSDLAAIAEHRLDVALRFGFRILRGSVLRVARHGVWSFHHGDNRVNRGGPAGAWEVLEKQPLTGAVLQVLTESLDGGHVLGRVSIATDRRSVYRNRRALYERAWPMMPRLLERLHVTGRLDVEPEPLAYDRRLYRAPSNVQVVRGLAGLVGRFVGHRLERLAVLEQWQLGYYLGHGSPAPFRFTPIEPPVDRIWADPFPVEVDDGYVVFFEELVSPRRGTRARGWISALTIDRDGRLGPVTKVLEEAHHLSYPLVVSWQGTWYMLPEASEANRVVLYRCTRFPDAWEPFAVLVDDVAGYDNTLAEIHGRWWLWVTVRVPGTPAADETLLFHADSPVGPFQPHRANPVVSDARTARGAGRPFQHEGAWIRPAQDGADRYGRAVAFMRLDRLDQEGYAETLVGRLEPRWHRSIIATHTYNRAGRLQVIDFLKRRSQIRRPTR